MAGLSFSTPSSSFSLPSNSGAGLLSGTSLSSIPNAPGYVAPFAGGGSPIPGLNFDVSGFNPPVPSTYGLAGGTSTPQNLPAGFGPTGSSPSAPVAPVHPSTYNNSQTGMVSTTGVSNEFNDSSNYLDQLSSAILPQLQAQEAFNQQQFQNAIASATAKTANSENINNAQENATIYGIRAQDAANGTAQYSPAGESLAVAGAQNSFQYKNNALAQQQQIAINAANVARQNGDVKSMNTYLGYLNDLQNQQLALSKFAFQQYQFGNLSADQSASLGIQQENANTNLSGLNLRQFIANNPAGTQTSASIKTPFVGQTTTKNVAQSVNIGGQYYAAGVSGTGSPIYQASDGLWYPVPQQ